MDKLTVALTSGVVSGALLALVAGGVVLGYVATGIFNLSFGAIVFSGAYVFYQLNTGMGVQPVLAAVLTVVICVGIGAFLERFIFRNLIAASEQAKLMATVGVMLALPAFLLFAVDIANGLDAGLPTGDQVVLPPGVGPTPPQRFDLWGSASISSDQLLVLGVCAVACVLLWFLLRKSRLGLRLRAVVDRRELAILRGIDVPSSSRLAWMIGSTYAAVAGILAAPILGTLGLGSYTSLMFIAIAGAVFGAFRSIPAAMLGALALAVGTSLIAQYLPSITAKVTGFSDAVPFVVLLAGLVVIGSRQRTNRSAPEQQAVHDYVGDLSLFQRYRYMAPVAAAYVLIALFWANSFWQHIMLQGLLFGVVYISITFITGLGGMVSLAQASFFYTSSLFFGFLCDRVGMSPWWAVLACVAVVTVVGALVAVLALRLNTLALALATFAVAMVADVVLFAWPTLINNSGGIQNGWNIAPLKIGGFDLQSNRGFGITVLVCIAVLVWIHHNVMRSASGRAALSIRSSQSAAASMGISAVVARANLFALATAITAVAGVLNAVFLRNVGPPASAANESLVWLAVVVLWGVRRPGGAIVAGVFAACFPAVVATGWHPSWLPSWLTWDGTNNPWITTLLFGLGAIQMSKSPEGILHQSAERRAKQRLARLRGQLDASVPERDADEVTVVTSVDLPACAGLPVVGGLPAPNAVFAANGAAAANGHAASALLSLEELQVSYDAGIVIRGISLAVQPGTINVVIGPNGAGKTTLCRTIAGRLTPRGGRVLFDGQDLATSTATDRYRRGLVLAPENRGIFPSLTVAENLSLILPDPAACEAVFERFPQLASRRKLQAGQLSGGEQTLLTAAPLFRLKPKLLVVDEPTLGLSPQMVDSFAELICELRDDGTTIVIVDEKAERLLDVADRVALFRSGLIIWQGAAAQVSLDDLKATFLGNDGPQRTAVAL